MYAVANNDDQLKQIKWEASLSLQEGIENFIKIKTNT
jgi:hypothetical protein